MILKDYGEPDDQRVMLPYFVENKPSSHPKIDDADSMAGVSYDRGQVADAKIILLLERDEEYWTIH